ncbi:Hypothetical_protein [Hexamita inflata]|uniref:Hypothetical_protein n=1 Tax=Hexamita inflata TaxID=28002 RepID=A0AA86NQF3_9EUKA|nr:Hypothetical protein HINF_LOCUS11437 [Hexamita inflata]
MRCSVWFVTPFEIIVNARPILAESGISGAIPLVRKEPEELQWRVGAQRYRKYALGFYASFCYQLHTHHNLERDDKKKLDPGKRRCRTNIPEKLVLGNPQQIPLVAPVSQRANYSYGIGDLSKWRTSPGET